MKNIFFVTWASWVWKTSLISSLKEKYKGRETWTFLHFDSIGIPTPEEMIEKFGSWENFQKEKTYEWIEKMVNEYNDKDIIIFEGQVNLLFIKEGFSQNNFSDYEIILIDCNEDNMEKRLVEYREQPELMSEDMRNWLRYLRKQAEDFWVNIIDTSNITREEVVKSFEKILKKRKCI